MQFMNEYHQQKAKTVIVNGESVVLDLILLEAFLDKAKYNNIYLPKFDNLLKEIVENKRNFQHQE